MGRYRDIQSKRSFTALALGVATAQACMQVDLLSIKNANGMLTDNDDGFDSLAVWMGVNRDIMITWSDDVEQFEEKSFSPGVITMPCFNSSVLWIEMEEQDKVEVDKVQVAVACADLVEGVNQIEIYLNEDSTGSTGSAVKVSKDDQSIFTFGTDKRHSALYIFTFDAVENCSLRPDQNDYSREADSPGTVRFFSVDLETVLLPKIAAANVANAAA